MTTSELTTIPSLAWHAEGSADVLVHLGVDGERGLTREEARRRLVRIGPNRIADQPETTLWRLVLDQFKKPGRPAATGRGCRRVCRR